jgi:carbamoyltransferase
MRILGLSSFRNDTAAALLENGVIRAAIEESKISRQKHAQGLPAEAVKFCLKNAGVGWESVDHIALATTPFRGWVRRSVAAARISPINPITAAHAQVREVGRVARELGWVRVLRHQAGHRLRNKIAIVEHHVSHASSAFFLSPYERALVITIDEDGDGRSGMIALGEGTRLRKLRYIPYPHSLAWLYSRVTEILGFVPHAEEHKTQWLSLGGEPRYRKVFDDMLRSSSDGSFRLDYSYLNHGVGERYVLSKKWWRKTGLPRNTSELDEDQRRALAASVQQVCTEKVSQIIETLRRRYDIRDICLAGGLFNNSLLVASLEQNLGLDHVFVPPAPGNSGTALGAALYLQHHHHRMPRKQYGSHSYWGPAYSRHEIKDVFDNCKARFSFQVTRERLVDEAVQLLLAGKIIAWFQGAAEFGPRALGNRSVLASPWAEYVKENLNDFIKHREWFRPFAVSVPVEDAPRYFECSMLCTSMNSLARVRTGVQRLPEGLVLPRGWMRVHTVAREANPGLWDLLRHFGQRSPAPMLINTSFNLFGEPLVVSPLDAVRSYACSGIDALFIDRFLLTKMSSTMASAVGEHKTALAAPLSGLIA